MTILGHRNESSYQRYDQSIDLQKIVAISIVATPYRDGKRRTYGEPFEELDQKRVARHLQEANNPMFYMQMSRKLMTPMHVFVMLGHLMWLLLLAVRLLLMAVRILLIEVLLHASICEPIVD